MVWKMQRRGVSKSLPIVAIIGALIVGLGSGVVLTLATFGVAGTTTIVLTETTTTGQIQHNYSGSITRPGSSSVQVAIQNTAFNPVFITIVVGVNNTVIWTNYDSAIHTVTDDNGAFDSGNLNGGTTWAYTFTTPGTYYYHCIYHSVMNAAVIVKAGSELATNDLLVKAQLHCQRNLRKRPDVLFEEFQATSRYCINFIR